MRKTITLSEIDHNYLIGVIRDTARLRCKKSNCGTVCLCKSCAARRVLPLIDVHATEHAGPCRCCKSKVAVAGDSYGRCKDCQDMVPTRRGGWRQLGVYDG